MTGRHGRPAGAAGAAGPAALLSTLALAATLAGAAEALLDDLALAEDARVNAGSGLGGGRDLGRCGLADGTVDA